MKYKQVFSLKMIIILLGVIFGSTSCSLNAKRDFLDLDIHSPFKFSNWVLYIPNRVFDVLDIVSVGASVGLGLYVKVQPTRIIKFAYPLPGAIVKIGLNTHYLDDLNPKNPFYLWKRYKPATIGTDGKKSIPFLGFFELGDVFEIKTSPDEIKIGAHILLVGADVGIRPVDILDLITGFFFIDINNDDLRFEKKGD